MPTIALTDKFVDTVKTTERIEYADSTTRGLVLRISETGKKTWTLRYRNLQGGSRRLALGTYPALSLKTARKQAEVQRGKVSGGADPAAEKRAVRRAAKGVTVAAFADIFIAEYVDKKKSRDEDVRILKSDIVKYLGKRPIVELTRKDIDDTLRRVRDRGSIVMANRVLAVIRKMLNFGIMKGVLQGSVASLIAKTQEFGRTRVLTHPEIRAFWEACAAERPATCAWLRLWLVTAQRGKELRSLEWAKHVDLDGGWLNMTGDFTKNGCDHRVPLSPIALEVFATIPHTSKWVFPDYADGAGAMSDDKAKDKTAEVRTRTLVALQQADPTITKFDFQGKDLRRTASTFMGEAGVPTPHIAFVLNHKEKGVPVSTPIYMRYAHDKEKRAALNTWGTILRAILKAKN